MLCLRRDCAAVVALLTTASCTPFRSAAERDGGMPDATVGDGTTVVLPASDAGPADADATPASPFVVVYGQAQGEALTAIWGTSDDEIFTVGTNGTHCDYYQEAWNCYQDTLGRDYASVWGTSATDVYAVGSVPSADGGLSGIVEHFDGTSWTDVYTPPTPVLGVWGVGPEVLAVGPGGHLYGTSPAMGGWGGLGTLPANPSVPVTASSPVLSGIAGNSTTDFEIAAGQDRVFQYAGSGNFEHDDPNVDTSIVFQSVWAVPGQSGTAFFTTNYFGVTYLTSQAAPDAALLGNGLVSIFSDRTSAENDQKFLWSAWGTALRTIFVGDDGRIASFDIASDDFEPLRSPTTQTLYGVWGSSLSDIWIVGRNELILHGSLAP